MIIIIKEYFKSYSIIILIDSYIVYSLCYFIIVHLIYFLLYLMYFAWDSFVICDIPTISLSVILSFYGLVRFYLLLSIYNTINSRRYNGIGQDTPCLHEDGFRLS